VAIGQQRPVASNCTRGPGWRRGERGGGKQASELRAASARPAWCAGESKVLTRATRANCHAPGGFFCCAPLLCANSALLCSSRAAGAQAAGSDRRTVSGSQSAAQSEPRTVSTVSAVSGPVRARPLASGGATPTTGHCRQLASLKKWPAPRSGQRRASTPKVARRAGPPPGRRSSPSVSPGAAQQARPFSRRHLSRTALAPRR